MVEENSNLNLNELAELMKTYNMLSQATAKAYFKNTDATYKKINFNIEEFLKRNKAKIISNCDGVVKEINNYTKEPFALKIVNNKIILPDNEDRDGKNFNEYNNSVKKLVECVNIYGKPSIGIMKQKYNIKKINNFVFDDCVNRCQVETEARYNNKINGEENLNELQYCLKDCYNMVMFNFKAYEKSVNSILDSNNALV